MWNQHLQTFRNRSSGGWLYNAVILKYDISTSIKEGLELPVRNHKVYCKVLSILLIHLEHKMDLLMQNTVALITVFDATLWNTKIIPVSQKECDHMFLLCLGVFKLWVPSLFVCLSVSEI